MPKGEWHQVYQKLNSFDLEFPKDRVFGKTRIILTEFFFWKTNSKRVNSHRWKKCNKRRTMGTKRKGGGRRDGALHI